MKHIFYLIFASLIITSCGKELCKQTVTYTKATAIYGDLEALRSLPVNAAVTAINNPGKIYVGDDFLLIGEENKGIHVIDNSDPYNPQAINFINIPQNKEYYVHGNTLYAESMYDVVSYDLTDLTNVTVRSREENVFQVGFQNTNAEGETLLGFDYEEVTENLDCNSLINPTQINYFGWNNELIPNSAVPSSFAGNSTGGVGSVNRMAFAQDHLFIINSRDLFVLSDFGQLDYVRTQSNIGWNMETIFPYEDNLFIGTQTGMLIYNLDTESNPEYESRFDHAQACDPVLPTDEVAYVTLRSGTACQGFSNELDIINISDLQNPFLENIVQLESPYGLSKSGNVLYIGEGENGLSIFDITDRVKPVLIKKDRSVEAYDIIAHPTNSSRILIAGTGGLGQYEIDGSIQNLTLLSNISF